MAHLRIAIGYRTEHRSAAEAVVLAAGLDKAALQAAIDAAPADIKRFEFGVFTPTGKANRNSTPQAAPASDSSPEPAQVTPPPSPSSEEQSSEEGTEAAATDGPQLAPESAPADAPKHRRR